jgi:hypothetical protein
MTSESKADQVRNKLLGAWKLVTWEIPDSTGTITYPLGPHAIGQLSYDATGRVSAQLVQPDQPRFASEDWLQARTEEKAAAWSAYFGYFGTFTIDANAGAVIHHIEGSWFPNLVGTQQIRYYHFESNDRLVLSADTAWGPVRIIWDKVK